MVIVLLLVGLEGLDVRRVAGTVQQGTVAGALAHTHGHAGCCMRRRMPLGECCRNTRYHAGEGVSAWG